MGWKNVRNCEMMTILMVFNIQNNSETLEKRIFTLWLSIKLWNLTVICRTVTN